MTDTPPLSVVVMGYRNRATIVDAVASVVGQRCVEPFEVLVVTSGDDGSAELVRERFPELMVIDTQHRLFAGAARNLGVATSTGEVVAFLAADCVAQPGWVSARLHAHGRGHVAVASAVTTAPPQRPAPWALHFDMYCYRLAGRPAGPLAANDPAAHGLSFNRALLERIGPFDETTLIGEDTDAAARVNETGADIWYEPSVVTAHRGPLRFSDVLREAHRRSERSARYGPLPEGALDLTAVLRAFGPMWWAGVRRRTATAWHYGTRQERARLVVSLPWLFATRAAALTGWYSVRLGRPQPGDAA